MSENKEVLKSSGVVIAVLEPRSGVSAAGKEWKTQSFVIETVEQYPKKQCFELFGVDLIAPNFYDNVDVLFNFESREYQGKWYSSARAYKVIVRTKEETKQTEQKETFNPDESQSDLPF